jgi:hypothetical protein
MNRQARFRHSVAMDRYVAPPRVICPWTLGYEAFQTEALRFGLKIAISALTRSKDIMVPVQHILDNLVPIPSSPIDEIFYVTRVTQPCLHPQFAVITVFNEAILESLLTGLADGVIYGVPLRPERLSPTDVVLRIPDDVIDDEPNNADEVVQALRDEVSGPVNQMALANILNMHHVDAHTVLRALIEYFRESDDRST